MNRSAWMGMEQLSEIEIQLMKSVAEIRAQTKMLSLDADHGATAATAIARLRAIEEHAERAEALLAKLPPSTRLYSTSSQAS